MSDRAIFPAVPGAAYVPVTARGGFLRSRAMTESTGSTVPDRIPDLTPRSEFDVDTVTAVDINPLLEGAILLALDELLQGHPEIAKNILLSARVGTELYNRVQRTKDVLALRRMSLAVQGEWP